MNSISKQELILNTIRLKGPIIPTQIAKVIGTDILFASAHLAELVRSNKLKISNTKIGGTPVYYLPGQESRLQELYKHLNDKEKKAYDLLKEKKILRDDQLEPLFRVALRAIKDFAVPLQITTKNNQKMLFWKWYLLTNEETTQLIKQQLQPKTEESSDEKQTQAQETKRQEEKAGLKKEIIEREEPRQEIGPEQKIEIAKHKIKEGLKIEQKNKEQKLKEKQIRLSQATKEKFSKELKQDLFLSELQQYFNQKGIKVIEYNVVRKNSEIDAIVKFPSVVGELEYYCKAKNKKNINDTDLSNALIQSQLKKMPILLLITGSLTKKAEALLNTEFKKSIVVKKID